MKVVDFDSQDDGGLLDGGDGVVATARRRFPPTVKKKLFWGSSWPEDADELARPFLRDACKVEVGSPVLKATIPIDQIVDIVAEDQKYNKLVGLLGDIADGSRILIFMEIKKGCESFSVNENVCQSDRVQNVSGFQGGYIPIMIATDAAARDQVLKNVKYVINYDFPGSIDDYVYRIVLAERKGTAYTFFTTANARCAKELTILLKEAGQKVSPELAALGRDVRIQVTGVVFFPMYPHCPEAQTAASFAVDEVNEKKKLQLHFVRVVEAYECLSGIPVRVTYVTLEAADGTACEMNAYGAIVARKKLDNRVYNIWPESSRKLREYPSIADNERQRERKGAHGVATV
ncbi:DEAD-box ATP-dependent RNA helicase 20-like [Pyrus ussuriensis x Pyrus communis]|uniref:DEAD-box ATP-dependent RNA helicase 20-like n=1 Tax=Pyrus ussuriensis x Pyrus communis TaxID=2448454 RepID=A0A5N5FLV2_9ROSA|nr:DEAD-box ATP-dependent RNA helicase 20-like [Pyrus ussuriensis x Pyrus communis]